jgi:kynurenine formamidase
MCLAETLAHEHSHDERAHHGHAHGTHSSLDEHDPLDGHAHDRRVNRRRFLMGGGAVTAGAALAVAGSALPAAADGGPGRRGRRRHVVDLTHRIHAGFPTFTGDQPTDEVVANYDPDGFYAKRWTVNEHTGTHIDTPGHFSEGMRLVDDLEAAELLAPIVVVDITRRAREDPNAMVTPDDLVRFERRHGRIPDRALVTADSGWAAKVDDPLAFLGGPSFPGYNFPGFGIEATDWLLRRRDPVGIGIDTVSLDPGSSTTFDVHVDFLGADRYGVECLRNLDRIPPIGAQAFVGAIPWEDGSGGPCRVIATW